MKTRLFVLDIENNPTILPKIIQTIKRRRININALHAMENADKNSCSVEIVVEADGEQLRLLAPQLTKLIDVLSVRTFDR